MTRTSSLSFVALLSLACTRVDPGNDEALADASESMSSESSLGDSSEASSSSDSASESGTPGTSETGSTSTDSTSTDSTGTDSTGSTSDSTSTSESTGTESTGAGGVTVDLGVLALLDVNPNSATFEQTRHPDDYQGGLSAWYFAHAT